MIGEIAKKLLEKEILTEKGVRKLISFAKTNSFKRQENLVILEFLTLAFGYEFFSRLKKGRKIEKQIMQEDEPKIFYGAMPLPRTRIIHGLIHPKRSALGYTRTRTLHDLKDIGLISEMTFSDALVSLKDSTIVEEVGLIGFVLEREQYYTSVEN